MYIVYDAELAVCHFLLVVSELVHEGSVTSPDDGSLARLGAGIDWKDSSPSPK